jgi:dipeptidyl aminopeptidase/acylaminoacyl peptidase
VTALPTDPASLPQDNLEIISPHLQSAVDRFVIYGLDAGVAARVTSRIGSMDDFDAAWCAEGDEWMARAESAAVNGSVVTAAEWFRTAYYCYRPAVFNDPHDTKQGSVAYAGARLAFRRAMEVSDYELAEATVEPVQIPVLGAEVTGYLVVPRNARRPVPGVFVVYGADGMKEEHVWQSALPLVRRGLAVLVSDGPGQGEALRDHGVVMRSDFEAYGSPAFDVLANHPAVDPDRIGLFGSSLGGYFASRIAATDSRYRFCVCNGGAFELAGVWEAAVGLRPQLTHNIGATDEEDAREQYASFTLDGLAQQASSALVLFQGEADRLIPVSQVERLHEHWGGPKDLFVWPGAGHYLLDVAGESFPAFWDVLARVAEHPTVPSIDVRQLGVLPSTHS